MKALAISVSLLALSLGAGCEKKKVEEALDKVGEAARAVGDTIAEGAKKAWDATKSGAQKFGEKVAEGAKVVGEKIAEGAKVVGEKIAAGAKVVAKEAKDGWITTKIKTKIGVGKLLSVSVNTTEGKVVLSGTVKADADKAEAEKVAKETDGVVSVENKIEVKP
jgi:hyperosmotically inducible protein